MRQLLGTLSSLAILLLCAGCGGSSGPGSTPQDTFAAAQDAGSSKDYAAIAELYEPKQLDEMMGMFRSMASSPMGGELLKEMDLTAEELEDMSSQELFAHMARAAAEGKSGNEMKAESFDQMRGAEIVDTTVNGEHAVIKWKTSSETGALNLVRVDGKWFIDME